MTDPFAMVVAVSRMSRINNNDGVFVCTSTVLERKMEERIASIMTSLDWVCKERKNNLRGGSKHFRTGSNNVAKIEEDRKTTQND